MQTAGAVKEETTITTTANVMARIMGLRILSGHETRDGLHLELEGGTALVFTADGPLIVALVRARENESVH